MRLLIPLVLFVIPACADFADPLPPSGQAPIVLQLTWSQEAWVDSALRVTFTRVVQDSRCPATALCVWAGDGEVELALGFGSGPSQPDTLHTFLDPKYTRLGTYRVTLLSLMPYPYSVDAIPPDAYVVRLKVDRVGR